MSNKEPKKYKSPIHVTKSFLPNKKLFNQYVNRIWKSNQLTNQGPILVELEKTLKNKLDIKNLHYVSNGTVALQIALRSLDITGGEIITTPFSYVATISSILWERCTPVFVDIDPDTFCIDPDKIESSITSKTKAIMAVHVFGTPCDVDKIAVIANRNNIKVIYDAAHAFGSVYKGRSLLDYGDISTCSFHSTKLFHTVEGGCVVASDDKVDRKLELVKRFGHHGDDHQMLGINAKASEFHAAMGLCNIGYIDDIIEDRKSISELYDSCLGSAIKKQSHPEGLEYNYAYYPVVFKSEKVTLKVIARLNDINVFPRRYFYPSLNTLPYLQSTTDCPVSESISARIICLPLYVGLKPYQIRKIAKIIRETVAA